MKIQFFLLLILTTSNISTQELSTFAFRMNGHKHNMEEDFVDRAIQEGYDAAMDSIDFSAHVDSLEQNTSLIITGFTPPEDINVRYLVDTTGTNDFMWQISLDGWTILISGLGCDFTTVISNLGFISGGTSQFSYGDFLIEASEPEVLEPVVDVNASGAPFCGALTDTIESSISILLNQVLDELVAAFDSLDFGSVFGMGDLISSFGIDNPELVQEALASFPMDMKLLTEYDPEQDVTQLIHEINFLTGTTEDSLAFVGIEPAVISGSQFELGGFSFLYHQLQRGFHWHTDWEESQRVSTAFGIMDSLGINGFRMETFWRKIQIKAYTGDGLDPASVTPDQIDSLLSDTEHWDVSGFDDVQNILDLSTELGFTPFMAIGVGHQDRMPPDDSGLRIAPASPDWVPADGFVGVNAQTYLYNLKIYAFATVKRFADQISVWQVENELNAAGFAASLPEWWRKGDIWLDTDFRDQVMAILVDAVRTEDPTALITHDLHMLGFMRSLESWVDDLDIIGFNYYPNQISALPVMGFSVGEYVWAVRRALKGLGYPDKPVWLIETGYPGIEFDDPPDTILLAEDAVYYSENRQINYIQSALSSAVENGINGFFYFSLTSEEDESVGGGGDLATFMRFSGLIRKDTDIPKSALSPYANLYNELVSSASVGEERTTLPESFILYQNFPNPFNPITQIRYDLTENGPVKLVIFDVLGRQVRKLQNEWQDKGSHQVSWDGTNELGKRVSSGIYFYQIKLGDAVQTKKMLLLN
ncbi:MAG: T9SS type A sorting domain-containing protein [Candidatus Marinimicrobia bacterium]|nr:T9SS type A sorting domain-containing protein [Candidatus Neomarinimicrobiota bacterium]